jgi:hypothetical protein
MAWIGRTLWIVASQLDSRSAGKLSELIASVYEKAGQQPPLAPRDMAIVIEALGAGLAFQAALDPEHVRMSLQDEILASLLRLPTPDIPPAATEPAASLPAEAPDSNV